MPNSRRPALALAALVLASGLGATCHSLVETAEPAAAALPALAGLDRPVSFEADVKPVLDGRCAVCHACYDAPCQLLLTSHAGAARGATKLPVYDTSRLTNAAPTRLGIDAHGDEWRAKGFHAVLGGAGPGGSFLARMLALGAARPFEPRAKLPASVGLDINRKLTCAAPDEFEAYAQEHPQGGMPYGTAPLSAEELRVLAAWVAQGAPGPAPSVAPAPADVAVWEAFLNGASLREKIVARYLYEHWFVSHLAFEDKPAGPFYRVVRSRTRPGDPIDEIATVRPYDDPGAPFWYRLRPLEETIVHKTHIVYPLGPARLARLRQLFLGPDWKATRLPSYAPEDAANPFVSFAEIPARARYQFLLDDARHFVMTFIRGPVCRGQVAVDVIEDHFWIAFADPDRDPSVLDPAFLRENARRLDLPAEHAEQFALGRLWLEYNVKQREYLNAREKFYDAIDPQRLGPSLDWVWDGDGRNPNALLTVFRNFDNAEVVQGFVGEIPKTGWVMDYPIFERIYYNLVAGYDVYGKVGHQVSTRLYMDHLRMQSENTFLGLLPADRREAIRASWYRGATRQMDYFLVNSLRSLGHGTQVKYRSADPMRELFEQLLARSPAVAGPPDLLNRCQAPPCDRADATPEERAAERALERLAAVKGPWVRLLPEVSLLRVRADAPGGRDLVYALVHNAAHTNVAFMFGEDERRLPADDTVTVVRGHFGSYPNFFFEAPASEIEALASALLAVASEADLERFVERYGIRRTDPRFWETADFLREDLRRANPAEAGVYDLGRYGNL
jgi:hypothetical protein